MNKVVSTSIAYCLLLHCADGECRNTGDPIKEFEVRPAVCLTEKDTACRTRFVFSWELHYATEVCLSQRDTSLDLVCSAKTIYKTEVSVNSNSTLTYDLVAKKQPRFRVSRHIEVLRLNQDVRVMNRRVWSVF